MSNKYLEYLNDFVEREQILKQLREGNLLDITLTSEIGFKPPKASQKEIEEAYYQFTMDNSHNLSVLTGGETPCIIEDDNKGVITQREILAEIEKLLAYVKGDDLAIATRDQDDQNTELIIKNRHIETVAQLTLRRV
ncbi:hypothetical protein P4637_17270 [Halalkalibacterium halodurans]|uniref:hypothetical protein n=1 Tax=Halalkalibacterium halodurans TaxID=86665 RepID=UPI002E1EEAA9|nr:hypothetical protein [Halalkalibacterium halodurans]MED4086566.1 hypothetical protein [Halalkalibacterium halodurans]MED4103432.1 hypothetical protein [Halalkalibacterium halodurans]MED4111145.1 hypothetical protein [Halalkalibacterium halodurans]MED4126389.1 hypothetical protein [Halalkalibacterium halodurans]